MHSQAYSSTVVKEGCGTKPDNDNGITYDQNNNNNKNEIKKKERYYYYYNKYNFSDYLEQWKQH